MDCIHLVQNMDQWWALVNAVMILLFIFNQCLLTVQNRHLQNPFAHYFPFLVKERQWYSCILSRQNTAVSGPAEGLLEFVQWSASQSWLVLNCIFKIIEKIAQECMFTYIQMYRCSCLFYVSLTLSERSNGYKSYFFLVGAVSQCCTNVQYKLCRHKTEVN